MARRLPLVVVALLLTLGLCALLAVNAALATRYRQVSVERVLRDYATLAADQFAARAETRIATQVYPIHALMGRGTVGAPHLDSKDKLAPLLAEAPRAILASARQVFRIDPATHAITVDGDVIGDADREAVRDSVLAHATRKLDREAYFGIVRITLTPPVLAIYGVVRDSAGAIREYNGLTLPDSALARPVRAAFGLGPLLPRSLVHDIRPDSVVGIAVSAGGPPILVSRAFNAGSGFVATRPLSAVNDLITIRASIDGRLAHNLIVGGLPRSQVPLLVALLAFASLLVVTAALQLRRERAFAALREDFVSGVSHELRTPLAQIRLFSETLRLGRVRNDAEAERSLTIIDQEARRLGHLVDNLLHFSRAERGAVRISPERTDLARLIGEIVGHFQPIADTHRVTIALALEPGVDVDVDPNAFRQVLLNLLDNALKYGPAGQVVTISSARDRSDVVVAVSDQGPGVPADARERIWDRFWRDERARASAVAGTGIGLAIVRELVTLHGGRCRVLDAPGGGARFEVRFPR